MPRPHPHLHYRPLATSLCVALISGLAAPGARGQLLMQPEPPTQTREQSTYLVIAERGGLSYRAPADPRYDVWVLPDTGRCRQVGHRAGGPGSRSEED